MLHLASDRRARGKFSTFTGLLPFKNLQIHKNNGRFQHKIKNKPVKCRINFTRADNWIAGCYNGWFQYIHIWYHNIQRRTLDAAKKQVFLAQVAGTRFIELCRDVRTNERRRKLVKCHELQHDRVYNQVTENRVECRPTEQYLYNLGLYIILNHCFINCHIESYWINRSDHISFTTWSRRKCIERVLEENTWSYSNIRKRREQLTIDCGFQNDNDDHVATGSKAYRKLSSWPTRQYLPEWFHHSSDV